MAPPTQPGMNPPQTPTCNARAVPALPRPLPAPRRRTHARQRATATATTTTLPLQNDLLTGMEWNAHQVRELLHLAADVKARPDRYRGALAGRFLALIFEKPSLRTRVTFEVGIASLGGSSVFLDNTVTHLGERESSPDVANRLERWIHGIVARVYQQDSLDQLEANAHIPVINSLSDLYHPCQAFSDFFTLEERFGNLRGLKVAYVGDGNNTCHSLIGVGARAGAHLRLPLWCCGIAADIGERDRSELRLAGLG
jgi:ornithine carbamoyltransferase